MTEEITVGSFTYRITKFSPFHTLNLTRKLGRFILPAIGACTDPELRANGGAVLAVGQLLTFSDEDKDKNDKSMTFDDTLRLLLFSDNIEVSQDGGDFKILKEIKKEMSFESMGAIFEVLLKVLEVNFSDTIKDYLPQFGTLDLKSLMATAMEQVSLVDSE